MTVSLSAKSHGLRAVFPKTGPALAEPPIQSAKKVAKAGQEALPEAATNRLRREEIITKCASGRDRGLHHHII